MGQYLSIEEVYINHERNIVLACMFPKFKYFEN